MLLIKLPAPSNLNLMIASVFNLILAPARLNAKEDGQALICYNVAQGTKPPGTLNKQNGGIVPIMQGREKKFDLAVVGGGPAGSITAALAAEAGLTTAVLEQYKMPRFKTCGGFVSARALSLLPPDLDLDSVPGDPVFTLRIIKGNRSYDYRPSGRLGILVNREHYDQYLLRYAAKKGAEILEEHTLQELIEPGASSGPPAYYHLESGEAATSPIFSRYVVGADGAIGRTGVLSGLRKTGLSPCGRGLSEIVKTGNNQAYTGIEPGILKFFPLPGLGGMGWSFQGSGWINRGVGGLLGPGLLKKAYLQLFAGEKPGCGPSWWPLPFLGPLKKAGCKNLLLIGDAAGLVEPFSGEGLFNAFKSAILAVNAIKEAEESAMQAADIYNRSYKNHFKKAFLPTIAGAAVLHSRGILHPASMPGHMAGLMKNRLCFNRQFKPWT